MSSQMGMRMHSNRGVVCGNNESAVCLVTAVQRYEKMDALVLSTANCEIPVWSDDDAGNSLKAEPI